MKALALILVTGCTGLPDGTWSEDTPVTARVDTNVTEPSRLAFHDRVRRDVQTWTDALATVGCPPPFHYTEDDDAIGLVTLTSNAAWRWPGYVGIFDVDSTIHIRAEGDGTIDTYANDPTWSVGVHELGHALGLGHNVYTDSVMCVEATCVEATPSARDVRDAAAVLGC